MKILLRDKEYEITKNEEGKYSIPKEIKELLQISVSCLNIDGNRVGTEIIGGGTMPDLRDVGKMSKESIGIDKLSFGQNTRPAERKEYEESIGRYPAQTFIDSQVAERLDLQSGVSKGVASDYNFDKGNQDNPSHNITNIKSGIHFDDIGGCSKILHKCDYTQEDYDLYFYEPKVSSSERNAGCDEFDEKDMLSGLDKTGRTVIREDGSNTLIERFGKSPQRNTHPTLKPIALNEKVLKLFKTPNPQKICYPFAGAGSEIIGGIKAGFDDWIGCEISQEYVDIANARIEYWKNTMSTQTTIFDFI